MILSPPETHERYLRAALDARLHVLCEKPLIWGGTDFARRGRELVDGFRARGLLLEENCQWPQVLDAFRALHPGWDGGPPRELRNAARTRRAGRRRAARCALAPALASCRLSAPTPIRTSKTIRFERRAGAPETLRVDVRLPRAARAGGVQRRSARRRAGAATRGARDRRPPRRAPDPSPGLPHGARGRRARGSAARSAHATPGGVRDAVCAPRLRASSPPDPDADRAPAGVARTRWLTPSRPNSSITRADDRKGERMHAIHDFTAKLRQPSLAPQLEAYLEWRRALQARPRTRRARPGAAGPRADVHQPGPDHGLQLQVHALRRLGHAEHAATSTRSRSSGTA